MKNVGVILGSIIGAITIILVMMSLGMYFHKRSIDSANFVGCYESLKKLGVLLIQYLPLADFFDVFFLFAFYIYVTINN